MTLGLWYKVSLACARPWAQSKCHEEEAEEHTDMMLFLPTTIILVRVTVSFSGTSLTHLGLFSLILSPLHCMVHTVGNLCLLRDSFLIKSVQFVCTPHMCRVPLETKRSLDLVL